MHISVLVNLAIAISFGLAFDSCFLHPYFSSCISQRDVTVDTLCASVLSALPSVALSAIVFCECGYAGVNYACAKTHCPTETSLNSLYLDVYTSCTSSASDALSDFVTMTAGELTSRVIETSSVTLFSTSSSLFPASTTTSSSADSISLSVDTTSAPDITASVTAGQSSSTASTNGGPDLLARAPGAVLNWFMTFMAVTLASL